MSVTNEELSVGGDATTTAANSASSSGEGLDHVVNGNGSATPAATTMPPIIGASGSSPAGSLGGGGTSADDIVKSGYLKKFKGSKKYFVLRKETERGPARLEYYTNERKFANGQPPRKSINLKACFNINQTDSKDKLTIALHTHNDCLRISMNNEGEMKEWLRLMNAMCEDDNEECENTITPVVNPSKQLFEHVWIVTALNKGLGAERGILGPYRLCLTSKELQMLKVGIKQSDGDVRNWDLTFPLTVIRNVCNMGLFFHIEVGRSACTGAGKLSLKTDDNNIAQNMHLLILNAMQNLPKEDEIRRDTWGNGWTSDSFMQEQTTRSQSFVGTPPRPVRPSTGEGGGRTRTWSTMNGDNRRYSSSTSGYGGTHEDVSSMSYSYGTTASSMAVGSADSTSSSSFSIDNENNNSFSHGHSASLGDDQSEYIGYNPNMDMNDGPSDYVDAQSPVSPYENYILMTPGSTAGTPGTATTAPLGTAARATVGGKMSVNHSRNSSLLEDEMGYMHTSLGNPVHSRSESGACSTAESGTGLDDAYFDMEFHRKLDLSNDDVRRMSPSSESIHSGTPSSDCQLEKVPSYLQSDDFVDDIQLRPVRAYSVGSRSADIAAAKNRLAGKMRLQAVQESLRSRGISEGSGSAQQQQDSSYRTRAMSVGAKQPTRRPTVNQSATSFGLSNLAAANNPVVYGSSRSAFAAPLSSSWSGSTARWPLPKVLPTGGAAAVPSPNYPVVSHGGQDSADSDLMELDFSRNKFSNSNNSSNGGSRKRSLPGPGNMSSASSTSSGGMKISPCPRAMMGGETPPGAETPDGAKSFVGGKSPLSSSSYATSAPISIQKTRGSSEVGYMDSSSSILTRITGMDLKKLKELDNDGAYLDMDFSQNRPITNRPTMTGLTTRNAVSNPPRIPTTTVTEPSNDPDSGDYMQMTFTKQPVVIKANENVTATKFNCGSNSGSHHSCNEQPSLSRSLSSSSNISTISNNSTSSGTSIVSIKAQPVTKAPSPERNVPTVLSLHTTTNTASNSLPPNSVVVTPPPTASPSANGAVLSRIEESPEKRQSLQSSCKSKLRKLSPSGHGGLFSWKKSSPGKDTVTYASIQHNMTQMRRNNSFPSNEDGNEISRLPTSATSGSIASTCGKQSQANGLVSPGFAVLAGPKDLTGDGVNYTPVDFGPDVCTKR